ncbi:hypothetical protein FOZ61_007846 [Perkinsus olseni]|uniref:Uncharacterized protein n=1 Tax=Perkinsus olseni TaxID=32597 RepID=A0A7J6L743_PEROL|nr:hypothetical protein FOZ61_007846 [Perkinsus olseni]
MWTTVLLLSLCTLDSVASLPPPNAPNGHLNFYKEVGTPWFATDDWHRVNTSGLARIAHTNFVTVWPVNDDSVPVFNTDSYAEESLHNATLAGADPSSLVFTIPLIAHATYDVGYIGYSNAIYDLGGDPKGDGSIVYPGGAAIYFFSQPRATEKITLAKNLGLYGISLEASNGDTSDLFPWDDDSLFYALAAGI